MSGKTRDTILDAVSRVLTQKGFAGTTIDAVAVEAGISKGGLLHHFPSKKSLLLGFIERYEETFRVRRDAILAKLPGKPSRMLKATIMQMLIDMDATREEIPNQATILDDEELRSRVGEFKKKIFKEVSHGLRNSGVIALIMFTIDGMWMDLRNNPPVIGKTARNAAIKHVLTTIDELK